MRKNEKISVSRTETPEQEVDEIFKEAQKLGELPKSSKKPGLDYYEKKPKEKLNKFKFE